MFVCEVLQDSSTVLIHLFVISYCVVFCVCSWTERVQKCLIPGNTSERSPAFITNNFNTRACLITLKTNSCSPVSFFVKPVRTLNILSLCIDTSLFQKIQIQPRSHPTILPFMLVCLSSAWQQACHNILMCPWFYFICMVILYSL